MKICLVGNQNCGKTTLFNALTGMNQKIGNWPGVTLEKKIGIIKETNLEIIDLPGIYSLNAYTEEEKVSSNYILKEKPDIIINVIDATCLERSLYLTTQLLELKTIVIVVLNMLDLLEKKGIKIDISILKNELNTEVCQISALKQTGIDELIQYIKKYAVIGKNYNNKYTAQSTNNNIFQINNNYNMFNCKECQETCIFKNKKIDYEHRITNRYNCITKITQKCLYKKKKWIDKTEMLDKIFLSKIFAIPIFILIMFGIYFLSVGVVGKYTINITNSITTTISNSGLRILQSLKIQEWLQSLIIDGAFKGVSAVLSFVPQLTILFTCISILEATGYMSRIAFLLDNFFRKIGLSGKAIIPFIIGSGCSVPGIMSSRIIENEDERKITTILVPFIPCSAKLPIIALFSGYFFEENAGIVSASLYFLSILIIIISSLLMRKYIFFNTTGAFISELPDYKIPNFKYLLRDVKDKVLSFIKRAGTTILFSSIIIWFLLSFSINLDYGVSIDKSILASIGKKISWIFYPILGINSWEATVSAIQGLIAKEQVVSSMNIIAGFVQNANTLGAGACNTFNLATPSIFSTQNTFGFFSKSSAYAFMFFNLFSAPCLAAISTIKKELGGFRKMFMAIAYQTTIAWILATLIYQFNLLLF